MCVCHRSSSIIIDHHQNLVWRRVHATIVDIVVALAALRLSHYVLLWIIEWLPGYAHAHTARRKLLLIERVADAMRRATERRAAQPN